MQSPALEPDVAVSFSERAARIIVREVMEEARADNGVAEDNVEAILEEVAQLELDVFGQ